MTGKDAKIPEGLYIVEIAKYKNMPALTAGGISEENWTDSDLLSTKGITLTSLTPSEAAAETIELVNSLCSSVNEKTAYQVLNLSWNMRSPTDPEERLFPQKSPNLGSVTVSSLSDILSKPAPTGEVIKQKVPTEPAKILEISRAGSFLAASLLKLFTKDEKSWTLAQDHIAEGYQKFCDVPFPFNKNVVKVWDPAVSSLRKMFQTKEVFVKTLAGILYSITLVPKEGRGMTTMLFEQHLSYTGMHIVGLFCSACIGLKVQPGKLMSALYTDNIDPVLDQLKTVITKFMGSKDEKLSRDTYKYARLYNPNMFSHLQTKNCAAVVCILANIGIQCGTSGSGNVLDIAPVAALGSVAKENCAMVAHNIFTYFTQTLPSSTNPMYRKV